MHLEKVPDLETIRVFREDCDKSTVVTRTGVPDATTRSRLSQRRVLRVHQLGREDFLSEIMKFKSIKILRENNAEVNYLGSQIARIHSSVFEN